MYEGMPHRHMGTSQGLTSGTRPQCCIAAAQRRSSSVQTERQCCSGLETYLKLGEVKIWGEYVGIAEATRYLSTLWLNTAARKQAVNDHGRTNSYLNADLPIRTE